MSRYSDDIAGALEAIQEDGALCEFTLPPTKADDTKPWEDAEEDEDDAETLPLTSDGYVAFLPAGRIGKEGTTRPEETGAEVPGGYSQGLLGNTPVLTAKHICRRTTDNTYWSIVSIDPLNVNGELILQTIVFQLIKK